MKKTIFIVGGVLALGVVGYLFLKNKKKQEDILGGLPATDTKPTSATSASTTSGTSTTNASSTTNTTNTTNVIQEQQNLDKANAIATKIKSYYKASATKDLYIRTWKPISVFSIKPMNPYLIMIDKLKNELAKLGYKFEGTTNGVLVKI